FVPKLKRVGPPFPRKKLNVGCPTLSPDFRKRWGLRSSIHLPVHYHDSRRGGCPHPPGGAALRDDVGELNSAARKTSGAKTAPDARVRAPGPTWTVLEADY